MRSASSLLLSVTLVGCATPWATLAVDLRTDLRPGADVVTVRTSVVQGADTHRRTVAALVGQDFLRGVRVAELSHLTPGPTRVSVELVGPEGALVAQRSILVTLDVGATAATVVAAAGCFDGELCEADCRADADCGDRESGCAEASCEAGVCLSRGDDAACGEGGRCDPTRGCRIETPSSLDHVETTFVCELINGDDRDDESLNRTHTRFNLAATDRGAPAIVGDALHLFFGDSRGWRAIWGVGEDPDSVGRVPLAEVSQDLRALCAELELYVTDDVPSVAADRHPDVLRDFEGAYLHAPEGESIRDYVDRRVPFFETATSSFAGTAEVPSGALGDAEGAYVFWAARSGTGAVGAMRRSFVARWDGGPRLSQRILYALDDVAWERPLGGHFIHVAPVAHGGYVYLFGAGETRSLATPPGGIPRDGVHLARVAADRLEAAGGVELWSADEDRWIASEELRLPSRVGLPATLERDARGVYELGAQSVESVGLFVVAYHQLPAGAPSRVRLAVAARPEGPWVTADVLASGSAAFRARHCCEGARCPGEQILRCDRGDLYGAYALPLIEAEWTPAGVVLDVPFVVSTLEPRNVALFRARVVVRGS